MNRIGVRKWDDERILSISSTSGLGQLGRGASRPNCCFLVFRAQRLNVGFGLGKAWMGEYRRRQFLSGYDLLRTSFPLVCHRAEIFISGANRRAVIGSESQSVPCLVVESLTSDGWLYGPAGRPSRSSQFAPPPQPARSSAPVRWINGALDSEARCVLIGIPCPTVSCVDEL